MIGAGAAGATLAARLSEDATRHVTLIEAGSTARTPVELRDGRTMVGAKPGHPANWQYDVELTQGRRYKLTRGLGIGGSSSINGGYQIRATLADFQRWSTVGGTPWLPENAIAVLASIEADQDFGASPGHGTSGQLKIARSDLTDPLTAAFSESALALGFPPELDKNAPGSTPGVGAVPTNIINGVRVNTAMAFLRPIKDRPNLRILGNRRCVRIRFRHEPGGPRAVGADLTTTIPGRVNEEFIAADEVVLSSGALETPRILMLSGIGPAGELRGLGLPIIEDLPVGEEFSDHPNLAIGWRSLLCAGSQAEPLFPAALHFSSTGDYSEADIEILLASRPLETMLSGIPGATVHQLLVALQRPMSRGTLRLSGVRPNDPLRIQYQYLQNAEDRARLRQGVRVAAQLLQNPKFSHVFAEFESLTTPVLDSDGLFDDWIAANIGTSVHTSGTAAMGRVVDGVGKVFGVRGVRVADTSILPSVPSRGPFNTAVFIGELLGRHMLEERSAVANKAP